MKKQLESLEDSFSLPVEEIEDAVRREAEDRRH
jgi:hypothetical protein